MALLPQLTPQPWQYGNPDPVLTQSQILSIMGSFVPQPFTGSVASPLLQTKTIWLSTRNDGGAGSGQSFDPYDASTALKLDALFPTLPAFARIIFGPGTYLTTSGIILKDGQTIEGAGIDVTIIKLSANAFVGSGQSISAIEYFGNATDGTGHSVRNLTIDTNLANQSGATGASTGTVNACRLQTLNGLIENVKVLGSYANPGEGFPTAIYVQNVGSKGATNPAVGNIKSCQFVGNGSAATGFANMTLFSCFDQTAPDGTTFTNQWMTGSIQDCTLVNAPGAIAFGAGGWYNFNIQRNKTQNIGTFMVQDTHKGWNVTVQDNTAEDLGGNNTGSTQWFCLANGNAANQYKNYKFLGNTSRYKSTATAANTCHFQIASPDMTDLLIDRHLADANGVAASQITGLFSINTPTGGIIKNLRASPVYIYQSGAGGSVIGPLLDNNQHFDGTPVADNTLGFVQRTGPTKIIKSRAGIDMRTGVANFTIFTVPTGQTFVLTGAYLVAKAVTNLTVQGSFVINYAAVANMSVTLATGTTIVAGQTLFSVMTQQQVACIAGQPVIMQVVVGATATTFLADIYVEGFYI